MTPTHARRGSRRYRYYVSHTLVTGQAKSDKINKRWRVPATELETAVVISITALLDNHAELTSVFNLGRLSPVETAAVFEAATRLSQFLREPELALLRTWLQSLVTRIVIAEASIAVILNLAEVRQALELLPLERDDEEFHTLNAPVRVTKRGVEQRLLIGNGVVVTRRDATLVQAIARAYAWFEDIRTGRIADLTQLAIREQLPRSYVQAHIPLACLAPRIIHAILEGRQPVDLTLKQLMYRTALSADWDTQCRQLQFAD